MIDYLRNLHRISTSQWIIYGKINTYFCIFVRCVTYLALDNRQFDKRISYRTPGVEGFKSHSIFTCFRQRFFIYLGCGLACLFLLPQLVVSALSRYSFRHHFNTCFKHLILCDIIFVWLPINCRDSNFLSCSSVTTFL